MQNFNSIPIKWLHVSPFPQPLAATSPLSVSMILNALDILHKWKHTVFVLLWLSRCLIASLSCTLFAMWSSHRRRDERREPYFNICSILIGLYSYYKWKFWHFFSPAPKIVLYNSLSMSSSQRPPVTYLWLNKLGLFLVAARENTCQGNSGALQ